MAVSYKQETKNLVRHTVIKEAVQLLTNQRSDACCVRRSYFNALSTCTEVVNVSFERTIGCEFKAHLAAIKDADTVIALYDPDDPRCEREAATVAVAEMLNKQVLTVDPMAIHLS